MRLNTLESVLWSLEKMNHEVKIPQEIRTKARAAIDRMIDFDRQSASKKK
jgi:quinolinate synthase